MNILTRWHESLDLLLSRQLFTFIKDIFCAIGRTYWLVLKYWWWLYLPLLSIESALWFLPLGYESLFFNRLFELFLFAGRLFCYFIMIVAAQAPDANVPFDYFKRRLSFSPIFFTLIIVYWMVLVSKMWINKLLSLVEANEPLYHLMKIVLLINQYILLYPTEIFASALFVFFVAWVIRDYFNGMEVAFGRAVRMLVYTYPVSIILNAGMWVCFRLMMHAIVRLCMYYPSAAYLCLLDNELLFAPISVAVFATIFVWHATTKAELYQ